MKRWGLSVVLLCGALYGLAIAPPVRANTSLCGTNDQLFRAVRRPLATDAAPAARAMAWLKQMMKPKRNSGDGSTITPAQAYGFDYQAKVSGRFRTHDKPKVRHRSRFLMLRMPPKVTAAQ